MTVRCDLATFTFCIFTLWLFVLLCEVLESPTWEHILPWHSFCLYLGNNFSAFISYLHFTQKFSKYELPLSRTEWASSFFFVQLPLLNSYSVIYFRVIKSYLSVMFFLLSRSLVFYIYILSPLFSKFRHIVGALLTD